MHSVAVDGSHFSVHNCNCSGQQSIDHTMRIWLGDFPLCGVFFLTQSCKLNSKMLQSQETFRHALPTTQLAEVGKAATKSRVQYHPFRMSHIISHKAWRPQNPKTTFLVTIYHSTAFHPIMSLPPTAEMCSRE